jgi:hypothetical protein
MSKNKFASVEKPVEKKVRKERAPKDTKKGLESLAELLSEVPVAQEPVEAIVADVADITDPTKAALAFLQGNATFQAARKITALRNQAQVESDLAMDKNKDVKKFESELGKKILILNPLQKDLHKEEVNAQIEITNDPDITKERGLCTMLEFSFHKVLDQAVQVALSKKPVVVELQSRIVGLTAEAEALKAAKAQAEKESKSHANEAARLTKEADALLASVNL